MDETIIQSRQNACLKRVRSAVAGKEPGLVVLEGARLVLDAVASGIELELLLHEAHLEAELTNAIAAARESRIVADGLLDGVGDLKTSQGVIALCAEPRGTELDALELTASSRILVVDGIADPGNLGALARSAEALGVQALLVVAGGARPWSPKALRGSMGSLLRLPVAICDDASALNRELVEREVQQVIARTRAGVSTDDYAWRGPVAIWVTSETGTQQRELVGVDELTLPMTGEAESLNVTVAASLLLDSARRGLEA